MFDNFHIFPYICLQNVNLNSLIILISQIRKIVIMSVWEVTMEYITWVTDLVWVQYLKWKIENKRAWEQDANCPFSVADSKKEMRAQGAKPATAGATLQLALQLTGFWLSCLSPKDDNDGGSLSRPLSFCNIHLFLPWHLNPGASLQSSWKSLKHLLPECRMSICTTAEAENPQSKPWLWRMEKVSLREVHNLAHRKNVPLVQTYEYNHRI